MEAAAAKLAWRVAISRLSLSISVICWTATSNLDPESDLSLVVRSSVLRAVILFSN